MTKLAFTNGVGLAMQTIRTYKLRAFLTVLGVIIGGLFVMVVASSVIQIGYFKISGGKRVFKMAPIHHHFELLGWGQVTIVTRFWIIAGLCAGFGMAIFYQEFVAQFS